MEIHKGAIFYRLKIKQISILWIYQPRKLIQNNKIEIVFHSKYQKETEFGSYINVLLTIFELNLINLKLCFGLSRYFIHVDVHIHIL
jgi:hypothetical protein